MMSPSDHPIETAEPAPSDRFHDGVRYLPFLRTFYQRSKPASYLEIGTRDGSSLEMFECDAVCVDPQFQIKPTAMTGRARTFLFQMTSDAFFSQENPARFFPRGVDAAFLDGMHRFEYLLRDFINTEQLCHKRSIVFFHDCFPPRTEITMRAPRGGAWTGDVWKLIPILKTYRKDLRLLRLDCPPTGLLAVQRVDSKNTALQDNYHEIVETYGKVDLSDYTIEKLWSDTEVIDTKRITADKTMWSLVFPTF